MMDKRTKNRKKDKKLPEWENRINKQIQNCRAELAQLGELGKGKMKNRREIRKIRVKHGIKGDDDIITKKGGTEAKNSG